MSHDDGYEYYCQEGSFACIDPEAECVSDDDNTAEQYEHCGWVTRIGDGMCDDENNKEECGKYFFSLMHYTHNIAEGRTLHLFCAGTQLT